MSTPDLHEVLKTHWGFDSFLPLQEEAMQCVMSGRDSLSVLPTGGGKSLCFQAPAVCLGGLGVVVSPLKALMKDQVDALRSCGVSAAAVMGSTAADDKRRITQQIKSGGLRLLYLSPEKLMAGQMLDFLAECGVTFFAIDEAHCISGWGHDFRPEYGELRVLRQRFPDAAIHAYTATATERVRAEIIEQLGLRDPGVWVGDFWRPNLNYRVLPREKSLNQVVTVMDKFQGQPGVVYCITRKETDTVAEALRGLGHKVMPYHAGLPDLLREQTQDAFLTEQVDCIVATIAFGMGIDKSNVRYVVHLGMPKSLENYQQESGRAGRDGEAAECWLLHSPKDVMTWQRINSDAVAAVKDAVDESLKRMAAYCSSVTCRHAGLVEHFGQQWTRESCGACDVCLGKVELMDDALVTSQKILSCVVRVQERFGASHVAQVLAGGRNQKIRQNRHDQLSTWGLLKEHRREDIRQWIDQLVSQGFAARTGEYHIITVTPEGRRVLRGEVTPALTRPARQQQLSPTAVLDSWEGVDMGLFEALRDLRRQESANRSLPAHIIFSDTTLRDIARRRPSNLLSFLDVHGVGRQKAMDFGQAFVDAVVRYCQSNNVETDVILAPKESVASGPTASELQSFALFDAGNTVDQVAAEMQRAVSTVNGYLESYIRYRRITDPTTWMEQQEFDKVTVVAQYAGTDRLKPIHEALHGKVPYERIRIAITCWQNQLNAVNHDG